MHPGFELCQQVLREQRRYKDAVALVAGPGEAVIPLPADRRSLHASLLVSLTTAAIWHRPVHKGVAEPVTSS